MYMHACILHTSSLGLTRWPACQWSTDIAYWLDASLDVGYQNQSTALVLGGRHVVLDGHGTGTLDGNGDAWYLWVADQDNSSNYPGRPHQVTFRGLTNSVVRGLNFLRSQMWYVAFAASTYYYYYYYSSSRGSSSRVSMASPSGGPLTRMCRTMSIIYCDTVAFSNIMVNNTGNIVGSCMSRMDSNP